MGLYASQIPICHLFPPLAFKTYSCSCLVVHLNGEVHQVCGPCGRSSAMIMLRTVSWILKAVIRASIGRHDRPEV